jgi:RNA polymerase sigma-70 factor (ECF subfamily)
MAPGEEETLLLERCRQGDMEAFDRLLTLHQDAVYRTALRLLGDPEEACDLAQDVLLTAFRKIHQFRGGAKFSTWLYRITVNLARNRWKAASRRPYVLSLDTDGPENDEDDLAHTLDAPDSLPGPRAKAADREALRVLEHEVAALPEVFREVIILRHVEECSYEEIAEVLAVNLGTVKSRLSRAREILRERLGPLLDEFFRE